MIKYILTALGILCIGLVKAQTKKTTIPDGKAVYTQHCMQCHQVDGAGARNMIPPLVRTSYVLGDKAAIIKVVLNGLNGEIKVNGDMYSNEMPPQNILTDNEIAAVLTYVRKSFGNNVSPVKSGDVKKIRATKK